MANTIYSDLLANSRLTTDLSVAPYHDDYDDAKNFYRILYRPGYAVQARELTQSQTILQSQLDRFGKHVFKEGSIVIPGKFDLYSTVSTSGPVKYVKVRDVDTSNTTININDFLDQTITGNTTNIRAEISIVADGTETTSNTKTIYVDYLGVSNSNTSIKTFQPGETLTCNAGTLIVVSNNATGTGSAFRISEGVIFAKQHFIYFPTQTIVLDRYNSNPTCKVGFNIKETIVRSTDDASLLDPALESSNYSAPGADRLKLDPELTVVEFSDPVGSPNFVNLFTIDDGVIVTNNERSEYNILADELAKRTYDESGDYFVRGLNLSVHENIKDATNGGIYSSANGGNSQLLTVDVSSGLFYVQGYEREFLTQNRINVRKSTNFETINSQLTSASIGSYVTVKEFTGSWTHDIGVRLSLYDTSQARLTNKAWSTVSQTGNKIGEATLVTLDHNTGTMGTPSATFDIYLSDINMIGSNTFSNVKNIYFDNASTADMGADIVLNSSNAAVLNEVSDLPLLYSVGSKYVKTLKPSGSSDTTFTYKKTTTVSNVASGTFTVALPAGADDFPYGSSTLSATQKREITISVSADSNVTLAGTITSNTGRSLAGSGTNFDRLNVGDKIQINGISETYYIENIGSATSLTVSSNITPGQTIAGNGYTKVYKTGDIIDLTIKGATAGAIRTVTSTAATQLSFDLKESLWGLVPATVTYRVSSTSSEQINKTLKPDRFVAINVANNVANTSNGPFSLGIPDVYKIKEIRRDTSVFTSNTQGTDVTSSFVFDNGQRDLFYDHATIAPRSGDTSGHLLVRLDYFEPTSYTSGQGFFSIDSYPVNDSITSSTTIKTAELPIYKSPTTGNQYDLRNFIDFRPLKSITATDSTTVSGASVNPATTTTYQYDVNGMRLPAAYSQISFDYEYYLARRDLIIINTNGAVSTIEGIPDENPVTPSLSKDTKAMTLGSMYVSPYPSISPFYSNIIGRRDLSSTIKKTAVVRSTMKDIAAIKQRVANLEYYASLSLLEKAAIDLKIPDDAGLDRFKNGIFVDTFANHLLGATYNTDYRIVVDPDEKSIRPIYTIESIDYEYLTGTNVVKTGNIITLDYDEVEYMNLSSVTTNRNTERTTYRFNGQMTLLPETDVWVDTQTAPDNTVTFPVEFTGVNNSIPFDENAAGITTTWNAWQRHVTGYKVYRGAGTNQSELVGTYATLDAANAIAQSQPPGSSVTVETLFDDRRSGVQNYNATDTDTVSLGESVIDVSIQPYIRPQDLIIKVEGLKQYAQHWPFFDGKGMSNWSTPLTLNEYQILTGNTSFSIGQTLDSGNRYYGGRYITGISTKEGNALYANDTGNLYFKLRLPEGTERRFTTGQKRIDLIDTLTGTNDADNTSYAKGYFFAEGLSQVKQETTLSTRSQITNSRALSQKVAGSSATTIETPIIIDEPVSLPLCTRGNPQVTDSYGSLICIDPMAGWFCLAYAFNVSAPGADEGIFVTSIDVFVQAKHPTLGAWFEIYETNGAGQIIPNQVPFSEVHIANSDIPISTNGIDNPLKVTFKAPVFLQKSKYYAFIIHPAAGNANLYLWASRIGETDINTGNQVTSRAYTGRMYTTNNGMIWDVVPDIDLTMKVYRASFDASTDGVFTIGNRGKEKFILNDVSSSITQYGQNFISCDKLTLSGISGGTINVTNRIIGSNSSVNATVISVSSDSIYANVANVGFISGEPITIQFANGVSKGVTGNISSFVTRKSAKLQKATTKASEILTIFTDSTGSFSVNDRIISENRVTANIGVIDKFRYSVADFEPTFLDFRNTLINFKMQTVSNTGTVGSYIDINPNDNYQFSDERALYSRSTNKYTNNVQVTMSSTSDYVSPVFDLAKTQTLLIDNIVNSNTYNENLSSGGYLYNKYISKTITLAEGQDAEDMQVILTSYRPPNTDVKVWIRLLNAEDTGTAFAQRTWIEMEKVNDGDAVYSSQSNKNDFIEYTYKFPSANLTGTNGEVQYLGNDGVTTFTGYKNFAIKIGILSDNSAIVPRVADLRTICLQM
jgi:hypothetical protein